MDQSDSKDRQTLVGLSKERKVNCRAIIFPGRYVQGSGALESIGELLSPLAKNVYILGGSKALQASLPAMEASLEQTGLTYRVDRFSGSCTEGQINAASEKAVAAGADLLIGVGGGRVIDNARAAAERAGIRAAIVPTVASTDAPTSTISVVYGEDGRFSHYLRSAVNPALVVVDTAVIASAPPRFFAAGIGGALAVGYEAEAAAKGSALNMAGGLPFDSVTLWALRCREIIYSYAVLAQRAVEEKLVTPAVEAVVEANLLLSGICFESGGLAAAHGVYHGFRSVLPEGTALHGEYVSFGTIVQLILENRPEQELLALMQLYRSLDLPLTLGRLGVDAGKENIIENIAGYAAEAGTTLNMPFRVDREMMRGAILLADRLGREAQDN